MKILLTGAFGNVGLSTLEELISRHHKIRIFDIPTKKNFKLARKYEDDAEICWGDLRNYSEISTAIKNIDVVLHIGAIIPPLADKFPKLAEAVNVGGTENIIKAIQNQENPPKLFYTSSISIYGDRRDNPLIKINDPLKPSEHDIYGSQKLKAEELIRNSKVDWTIFRLTYITSINKLQMDPLMFHMPLDTKIEICDTKDVGHALVNALDKSNISRTIFQIAGGNSCRTTYGEYLIRMFHLFGIKAHSIPAQAFSKHDFHCGFMDTQHSQDILHYQRSSLEDYYKAVKKKSKYQKIITSIFHPLVKSIVIGRSPIYKNIPKEKRTKITIKDFIQDKKIIY